MVPSFQPTSMCVLCDELASARHCPFSSFHGAKLWTNFHVCSVWWTWVLCDELASVRHYPSFFHGAKLSTNFHVCSVWWTGLCKALSIFLLHLPYLYISSNWLVDDRFSLWIINGVPWDCGEPYIVFVVWTLIVLLQCGICLMSRLWAVVGENQSLVYCVSQLCYLVCCSAGLLLKVTLIRIDMWIVAVPGMWMWACKSPKLAKPLWIDRSGW